MNIFNASDYWNGIPEYIRAHGYDVFELRAAWRGPNLKRIEQFKEQIKKASQRYGKVHLLAHSLGALNALEIIQDENFKTLIASSTFISPPFDGTPIADLGVFFNRWGKKLGLDLFAHTNETLTPSSARAIVNRCRAPAKMLVGSVISRPQRHPISPKLAIQHFFLTRYLKSQNLSAENDALVSLDSQLVARRFGPVFFEFPGDHMQIIGAGPWPPHEKTAHELFLQHCIFLAENDLSKAD